MLSEPVSLAIFCKVVDNFGDIGICWRLARQLTREHGASVTLWVDDLASFQRICPALCIEAARQQVSGVTVRHWHAQDAGLVRVEVSEVADIVIEFFACDIAPAYITAMAQRTPRPVWLNLEGLSAEEWVEGCHRLPSMHPRLPLTKHFFFPGFTARTGGLLREADLRRARVAFQEAQRGAFLAGLGLTPAQQAGCLVSLFCYPHAPVAGLFDAWRGAGQAVTCLVPEGVASSAVEAFLGGPARAGATHSSGALHLRVLPFLEQSDYDRLLWACDFNLVRGEDSFVRAQWAGRPFAWHIYPQDERLHHVKLRAFLQRYAGALDSAAAAALAAFSLHWNGALDGPEDPPPHWPQLWQAMRTHHAALVEGAAVWEAQMEQRGDLASNLMQFARSLAG